MAKGHKNKRLKKEIKKLRHMNRILKVEKESWKQRYEKKLGGEESDIRPKS